MTNFTYDAYGNLATVADATGLTTQYAYDLMGRVRTIFRPDGSTANFAYDAGGNMTVQVELHCVPFRQGDCQCLYRRSPYFD